MVTMAQLSARSGIKMPAAFDQAVKLARKAGWTVARCRGSRHIQWKPPGGGQIVITSSTPSDSRTVKNELAMLRRAGLGI